MGKKKTAYAAWLVVGSGLIAVIGGLAFYKFSEIKSAIAMAESFPEHYEVVDVAYVEVAEHTPTVSVLGNAVAPLQTALFTERSGKVAFVGFRSGEEVAKGEVLFQLNITEELARIKSAEARERHAKSVFQRYKTLLAKKAISQEQYEQAYADLIVIQSEIDVLKTTIDQKTVIAPFSGVLGMHSVKRGDYVSANQMLSNFVGETTDIWVEFSVPQFYPQLEVGSQVRVRNIDALGRSTFQLANVIAKDTQISSSTRSLKYRAALSQHIANYTSNTPLEVLIPISANKHVFKVPSTSVNQDLYGAYVVKLVEQDDDSGSFRAERLSVAVIAEKENVKFISHGVYQGEAIAAAGAFKLYEGILVRVRENRLVPEEAEIALAGGE